MNKLQQVFGKKPAQAKAPRLHQMLGTKNEAEQVNIVQRLTGPIFMLSIMLDTRTGDVRLSTMSNSGQSVPLNLAYQMLDAARQQMVEAERQGAAQQARQQVPPQVDITPPPAETPAPAPAETQAEPEAETPTENRDE